ncbi:hypothetical protein_gp150 [Bacillus phage vB_BceM_WH1]|nr:hypothetical protein_gp150 [Bacillus phage vB_BceM_WH1]
MISLAEIAFVTYLKKVLNHDKDIIHVTGQGLWATLEYDSFKHSLVLSGGSGKHPISDEEFINALNKGKVEIVGGRL